MSLIVRLLALVLLTTFYISPVHAIVDPLAVPNNKFGIHIIQATKDESAPAANLVNTNGDWGYITVLIESKDRNHDKWQEFFNDLRRKHLIPLVRLATKPVNEHWERPYEGEEEAWADFLDRLNWPTKNRYVIIYNEPNHGKEWGNSVDAKMYAKVLDKTITALKNKNRDFFVLNAGFDASAPSKMTDYEDESLFLKQTNEAVPGIFERLDGWVSHSYPNPDFAGSPDGNGRGTVRTWFWELQQLRSMGVSKNLPVFITETGWKHAEGLNYDPRLPDEDTVARYYKKAFESAWSMNRIVAVTPFLLSYQEAPFDQFSFKKLTGEKQNDKILPASRQVLEAQYPEYYSMYQMIMDLQKIAGKPIQEKKFQLNKGEIYSSIVAGENYTIFLTFKNTGQSIWNDRDTTYLKPTIGGRNLGIKEIALPKGIKVEPGQEYTFKLDMKAPLSGNYKVALGLFEGEERFDSDSVEFTTQVKSPVILKIKGALAWKNNFHGDYILTIKGATGENSQNITLDENGLSEEIEAKYLLPDYSFEFSLERPFYQPKLLRQKALAGVNTLDFGDLQPDLFSAVLNPKELWKLLPFSE